MAKNESKSLGAAKDRDRALLRLEDIGKYYGTVHALRGVSFSVSEGEVVGLIGDNGAGKSTLIKIVSGVTPKSSGSIFWKGEEVEISSVKLARRLGIETVYQDRAVVGSMTVAENIFMGRELVRPFLGVVPRLDRKRMREEAGRLVVDLKLNIPTADHLVRFCSGGEMQGVAISRAMRFRASLVILDEPTTALAVSGAQQVLDFIRRLKRENIACIFVTHNLHDVYEVADRFVVMLQGKVVSDVKRDDTTVEGLVGLQLPRSATGA